MERVNEREVYWYIDFSGIWYVDYITDLGDEDNVTHSITGNRFHTKEEAESMLKKLRAVLKGADVIEMPSEEEININSVEFNPFQTNDGDGTLSGFANGLHNGFSAGFNTCVEWLKSKIVK